MNQRSMRHDMSPEIATKSLSALKDRKQEIISELKEIVGKNIFWKYFFRTILSLCRPLMIFEGCLDSIPSSWPGSPILFNFNLATHLPNWATYPPDLASIFLKTTHLPLV